MGAAKAVLVSDPSLAGADALTTAKVLAGATKQLGDADLIIAGTESSDGYTGTVPEQLAEVLGLPSITFAKSIEIADGTLKVDRQTEAGYDEVTCSLPAVVSVTAGVVEPRYPSFKGIMAAKSKPVETVTAADSASSRCRGPSRSPPSKMPPSAKPARSSKTTAKRSTRSSSSSTT
jgi:electron transfer flavoprotein beta subunit